MLLKLVLTASALGALLLGVMVWWNNMASINSKAIENPDAPGREGHPQIFEAIEDSDHDRVARLIASGANLEALGFSRRTPILKAALTDNWIIVEMLLEAGADPMVPSYSGITLPAVAADMHLKPESDEGQALTRVRSILADRGLITLIFKPAEVRKMVAEGRWPPAPRLSRGSNIADSVPYVNEIVAVVRQKGHNIVDLEETYQKWLQMHDAGLGDLNEEIKSEIISDIVEEKVNEILDSDPEQVLRIIKMDRIDTHLTPIDQWAEAMAERVQSGRLPSDKEKEQAQHFLTEVEAFSKETRGLLADTDTAISDRLSEVYLDLVFVVENGDGPKSFRLNRSSAD